MSEWHYPTVDQEARLYLDPTLDTFVEQKLVNGELSIACNQDSLVVYRISERARAIVLHHKMPLSNKPLDDEAILAYLQQEGEAFGCPTIIICGDTVQLQVSAPP